MRSGEHPGLSRLDDENGQVTLFDGQGRVVGYVDPTTRLQTDIHGQVVRRVPVSGRSNSPHGRRPVRSPVLSVGP
jgi:hypothetical protein